MMALRLYNTFSRKIEVFKSLNKGIVLYYTCGPTVHDYAHIGNFRTFVVQDVLKRWLQAKRLKVRHVMNITDVDEKTIERARRKRMPLSQLTRRYEKVFFEDLDCLNIKRPDHAPRVSENMDVIAKMVKGLHERGHAFIDEDGSYYYDINTYKGYGSLSGIKPRRRIRARMPREDYKTPKNFLLWRACEGGDTIPCWTTELGTGIPGWHIECAALATRYLGPSIDIHSGGSDLVFPHHENEIAEAEGYTGKPFARFWVHVEHLMVYGRKMSKSLGNFYTLRQLIRRGYDPRAIRLLYLKTHYRSKLDFRFEELEKAGGEIEMLERLVSRLRRVSRSGADSLEEEVEGFRKGFTGHMDDDLRTDLAVECLLRFARRLRERLESRGLSRGDAELALDAIGWADSVLGFMGECRLTQ